MDLCFRVNVDLCNTILSVMEGMFQDKITSYYMDVKMKYVDNALIPLLTDLAIWKDNLIASEHKNSKCQTVEPNNYVTEDLLCTITKHGRRVAISTGSSIKWDNEIRTVFCVGGPQ